MVKRRHFFKVMIPGRFRTRLVVIVLISIFSPLSLLILVIFSNARTEEIPPDFVKHISKEASMFATLTLEEYSSGSRWFVKLSETTDGVYLEDGWQDFVNDHSINDYDFLVFGYDGNTCFNVLIFDKGARQRVFDSTIKKNREPAFSNGTKKCDKSSEITPTDSVKKASKDDAGQSLPSFKSKGLKKDKIKDVVLTSEPLSRTMCSSSRRRPATEEEEARVWKPAESFTPEFPYFRRCLTKSNLHRTFILEIPAKFATAHGINLHTPQKAEVTLWNTEGKAWRVNLICSERKTFLSGGWSAFVLANKLEEADVCIFELLGKFEMRVHIFRAVNEVECATEEQI